MKFSYVIGGIWQCNRESTEAVFCRDSVPISVPFFKIGTFIVLTSLRIRYTINSLNRVLSSKFIPQLQLEQISLY